MESTNDFVHWNDENKSFVITDKAKFAEILPKYFKTKNFTSFIRQLNMYNFLRVKNSRKHFEFRNPHFQRDAYEELWKIKRRPVHNTKNKERKKDSSELAKPELPESFKLTFRNYLNAHASSNISQRQAEPIPKPLDINRHESFNELKALFLSFCYIASEQRKEYMVILRNGINDLLVGAGVSPRDNLSLKHLIDLCMELARNGSNKGFVEGLKELWRNNFSNIEIKPKDIFVRCKDEDQQNQESSIEDVKPETLNQKKNSMCDRMISVQIDMNLENRKKLWNKQILKEKMSQYLPSNIISVPITTYGSSLYQPPGKKKNSQTMKTSIATQ